MNWRERAALKCRHGKVFHLSWNVLVGGKSSYPICEIDWTYSVKACSIAEARADGLRCRERMMTAGEPDKHCWRCLGSGMIRVASKRRPEDPPPRMAFGELQEVDVVQVQAPCMVCRGTGLSAVERKKRGKYLRQGIVGGDYRKGRSDAPDATA